MTGPPEGWDREQVSHLAHAAREARMLEAEKKSAINWTAVKDWFMSKQLAIAIVLINLLLAYYFYKLFRPTIAEDVLDEEDE